MNLSQRVKTERLLGMAIMKNKRKTEKLMDKMVSDARGDKNDITKD